MKKNKLNIEQFVKVKGQSLGYVPFNSQGDIRTGLQNLSLVGVEPTLR